MRYNSERLDNKVLISGNGLLFNALILSRKMHALFRENRHLGVSTTANNRIKVCIAEPKI